MSRVKKWPYGCGAKRMVSRVSLVNQTLIPAYRCSFQLARTFRSCYSKRRDPYLKPVPLYFRDCLTQVSRVSRIPGLKGQRLIQAARSIRRVSRQLSSFPSGTSRLSRRRAKRSGSDGTERKADREQVNKVVQHDYFPILFSSVGTRDSLPVGVICQMSELADASWSK